MCCVFCSAFENMSTLKAIIFCFFNEKWELTLLEEYAALGDFGEGETCKKFTSFAVQFSKMRAG